MTFTWLGPLYYSPGLLSTFPRPRYPVFLFGLFLFLIAPPLQPAGLARSNEHRGALRGTPGSAYTQPEPNATELPSSAPGRPKFIELQASAPAPTPTRAEENIASAPSPGDPRRRELRTSPDCRPCRASRLRALARRRAPRLPIFKACMKCGTAWVVRSVNRQGTAPRIA